MILVLFVEIRAACGYLDTILGKYHQMHQLEETSTEFYDPPLLLI